jgi:hypothetical protein
MADAVAVKISKRNHRRVMKSCKRYGHSISWLLNYVLDCYFDGAVKLPVLPTPVIVQGDVPCDPADLAALKKQFENGADQP